MASGGKRGAGDRVLESKHVIGLFLLMLLFSGVFFSLGYVMGRNQYDGQVRAAMNASKTEPVYMPKPDAAPKKTTDDEPPPTDSDPSTQPSASAWNFPSTSSPTNSNVHWDHPVVQPAPSTPSSTSVTPRTKAQTQPQPVAVRTISKNGKNGVGAPVIPSGAYVIQVAALLRQDDAVAIASNLQKKHYSVYVQTPQKDKYYRVQVGPFKDQKSAEAAKKGLQGEGFKAFFVKH
jgi:septal ring-binding cell division protein DamX